MKKIFLYLVMVLILSFSVFAAPLDNVTDMLSTIAEFSVDIPHPGYVGDMPGSNEATNIWLIVGAFLLLYYVFYALSGKIHIFGEEEKPRKGFSVGLTLVAIFAAPLVETFAYLLSMLFSLGLILGLLGVGALIFLGFKGITTLTKAGTVSMDKYGHEIQKEADELEKDDQKTQKKAMGNLKDLFKNYHEMGEEDWAKAKERWEKSYGSRLRKEYKEADSILEENKKEKERISDEVSGNVENLAEIAKKSDDFEKKKEKTLNTFKKLGEEVNNATQLANGMIKITDKFISDCTSRGVRGFVKKVGKKGQRGQDNTVQNTLNEERSKLQSKMKNLEGFKNEVGENYAQDRINQNIKNGYSGEKAINVFLNRFTSAWQGKNFAANIEELFTIFDEVINLKKRLEREALEGDIYNLAENNNLHDVGEELVDRIEEDSKSEKEEKRERGELKEDEGEEKKEESEEESS